MDRLYTELTDDGTAGSRRRMAMVEAFARESGILTLAAHKVTYLSPTDYKLHEVLELEHGIRARAAGLLESLQRPPTRSGRPVYFLLIEDEAGLLQATIFERVYERYGHVLHESGAFLLEGRVEVDRRRDHSYLVERIHDLSEVLSGEPIPEPTAVPSSGTFVRARRGSGGRRRAG